MLKRAFPVTEAHGPAIRRLTRYGSLDGCETARIIRSASHARFHPARSEIASEGGTPARLSLLLRGWIAHQRILRDGRRQIVAFTLPGEMFGANWAGQDRAEATQIALTDVLVCSAPLAAEGTRLREAYRMERLAQRRALVNHITRLGRMDARERVCDMLIELLERLSSSGEADGQCFDLPLTQECFADALGLTPVHMNRTIQACRRSGDLSWRSGQVTIHDPAGLARSLGRRHGCVLMETISEDIGRDHRPVSSGHIQS